MRTSMNIPDSLLEEARNRAAGEGTTVTRLVIEGLRERLAAKQEGEQQASVVLPTRSLGRSVVDLSDNRALRTALDADDDDAFRDRS